MIIAPNILVGVASINIQKPVDPAYTNPEVCDHCHTAFKWNASMSAKPLEHHEAASQQYFQRSTGLISMHSPDCNL